MLALCALLWAVETAETADSIMAKVAANQDRAQAQRRAYVYHQDVLVRIRGGTGKVVREEKQSYTVTPTPTGFQRELLSSQATPEKARELDRELAHDLAEDLVGNKKSRDGVDTNLFPLTAAKQKDYVFKLVGAESYRGRSVHHIAFEPREGGNSDWTGDALIDRDAYQPVLVTTRLAHKIPKVIRYVFGTNIQHLGFKVAYREFDGQWFPDNYSGEMNLQVLFMLRRKVGISMRNTDFRRSDVSANITYQEP